MAMKTKIKPLIRSMLLIFSLWTCLQLSAGQVTYTTPPTWGPSCGNSHYTNGSLFQLRVNQVLESLVVNVSTSGFNTSSVEGQNRNSSVYGLFQCRGDFDSTHCQQCASTAKAIHGCFIQIHGCFLRYDNYNFYNYSEGSQIYFFCSSITVNSDQYEPFVDAVLDVLSNISKNAAQNPQRYAKVAVETVYSPSKRIYSIAQCWRDLSQTSCQSCFDAGRSNITAAISGHSSRCQNGTIGAQFHAMGCQVAYDIYQFLSTPILSPGKKGRKREVLAITLGVVAATVGLVAVIGLFRFRPKCCKRISRTRGAEIAKSLIQVDLGGHPPSPRARNNFHTFLFFEVAHLLFLAVLLKIYFRGRFEGLNDVFPRSDASVIADGIIESMK